MEIRRNASRHRSKFWFSISVCRSIMFQLKLLNSSRQIVLHSSKRTFCDTEGFAMHMEVCLNNWNCIVRIKLNRACECVVFKGRSSEYLKEVSRAHSALLTFTLRHIHIIWNDNYSVWMWANQPTNAYQTPNKSEMEVIKRPSSL